MKTTEDIIKSLRACCVEHNCGAGCMFDETGNTNCVNDLLELAMKRLLKLSAETEDKRSESDE